MMQRKMDMRYSMWIVKSLYRAGFLTTVAREMPKHKVRFIGSTEGQMK
jgi:hypothetical protein